MSKKKKINKKHEEQYIAFLKKRLESKNYKNNVSKEEYKKTQEKYQKAKLRFRLLFNNI
jgi:Na+-translocating ferredoxin:NAD+ oxidoreductase RnfG subunit